MRILYNRNDFMDTSISMMHDAEISNIDDDTIIVLGGCVYANMNIYPEMLRHQYSASKIIAFNQEQISLHPRFNTTNYINFLRECDEVWAYDDYDYSYLMTGYGLSPKLYLLKYTKEFDVPSLPPNINKGLPPNDVLFYGALNHRREAILNELSRLGIKLHVLEKEYAAWGSSLTHHLMLSKIWLNIHYYCDNALQEQARMIRWLSRPERIVSENSKRNYLCVPECTYDRIVDEVMRRLEINF